MLKKKSIKYLIASLVFAAAVTAGYAAYVGQVVSTVQLYDVYDKPMAIPHIGSKVVTIMYTDPDVKDVNDPLSDAIKAKNFPGAKYAAVGIANCKVTWIPDAGIRAASKKKQQQFKDSTIMLDTNKALATAWQLGDCNGAGVVIIVGKDKKIKYINYVKSADASRAAANEVLPIIEAEIKK